ncbi:MAG: hypothetical protein AUK63_1047 [bacterium P3]|nr:MAG: hypothetical protein AUK63_1047 [bacterium P3]KWW40740.1 MAG: hypothetical protein F083_1395 [bacterium F083]
MRFYIFIIILVLTVIAAVAVTGFIFYMLAKRYFDNLQKQQLLAAHAEERRALLQVAAPVRLQAYERMALFLERISPDSLILRCYQPGMDLKLLQNVLTKNIRDEWEHNLSQQIYLSSEAWARIREAKEEMTGMVNSAAVSLPADADPATLAATIFAANQRQSSVASALEFLKAECEKQMSV